MLTADDLKKLRGVIREETVKSETKIRGEISGSERKIRGEITNLETKMELRFDKQDKQMEQDRHAWAQFFNEAGIFFDEMRGQLVKRIKKLEDKEQAKN